MSKNKSKPQPKSVPQQPPIKKENAGFNVAAMLANAYRNAKAKKSPVVAMSLNLEMLEQEMSDALETLSQNGVEIHATDKTKNNQAAG